MARGMWTGIAAGLKDIEDKKRYDLERQDKLSLLDKEEARYQEEKRTRAAEKAQERNDRRFEFILQNTGQWSPDSVLTPISSGEGTAKSSSPAAGATSYEKALQDLGFENEQIVSVAERAGAGGLKLLFDVAKANFNEKRPYTEAVRGAMADSIILTGGSEPDVDAYLKAMNFDLNSLPEEEQAMNRELLRRGLSKTSLMSSYPGTPEPLDIADLESYKEAPVKQLEAAINIPLLKAGDDKALAGRYGRAKELLKLGDPSEAVNLLLKNDPKAFVDSLKSLVEQYPEVYGPNANTPIGPIKYAFDVFHSIKNVPTPEEIAELVQNKDDTELQRQFKEYFGIDPIYYLQ